MSGHISSKYRRLDNQKLLSLSKDDLINVCQKQRDDIIQLQCKLSESNNENIFSYKILT